MKKITTSIVTLLLAHILTISTLTAQTNFSTATGNLSIFYPPVYDATQHTPSFAIQNEPVVAAGLPGGWKLNPIFSISGSNAIAKINCGTGIDFYGTGEVTGALRRNNTSITLWNTDNYTYASYGGQQLYQSHPWVMGVRADGTAFGVIADNTWEMTIAITDTSITFNSQGPAFRVLTFEAASPQAAVQELGALTGKISLPPIWSLGYHQCRYSYTTDTQVKAIADSFRANQLPCDNIWMDIDYMDQYKIFTFSPTGYPDPAGLNTYLHSKQFHSIWMIDPGVKQQAGYTIYDQGTAGNNWVKTSDKTTDFVGNVWPGACVFPDFTMPSTRTWWSGLYSNFMATGVDGVWNDMNEPSVFGGTTGSMPTNNWHRGGGTLLAGSHLRYHNVFGRLMVQASRAGIQTANPTKRPFILSRSNFLGGQQYAATWTGDNMATAAHMQLSVPMILTMGLSGQPMVGADVTGYSGSPSAALIGQWMALGTFYPFYRNHAEKGSPQREPWVNGPATEQICRIALQRRYRLLPYLYTLTQESSTDGMPIMRPLFFAEPSNTSLRAQQQAFMLGDILMIVPKWATGVNYPSGVWTSISLVGEDSKNDPTQPNILIKAGSILPLGQIIQNTVNYNADSLSLIVSLDASNRAHGINYTDSGEGYSYQSGAYLMREFNIQPLGTDSLILTATVDSGSLATTTNRYRVGIVTPTGINYTTWTNSNVIKIPLSATGEAPYGGTPWPIPGTIQAENFDVGGQGIAYYDTDTANQGGQYRTAESVDIENCSDAGGGYDVGYIATGEWENYTVNVTAAGVYTIKTRVGTTNTGEHLHIELDGVNISGTIVVPNTGGYQTWQTVTVTTPVLTTGKHLMRIYMETGGFNLNYVTFLLNAPVITSGATANGTVGTAFSGYTITATNSPVSYAVTGLPAGLSVDITTGIISGTPTVAGTFIDTLKATNADSTGTKVLTITINPSSPVITSAATASGITGVPFNYTITATNTPTGYVAIGLPTGLALNTSTGLISGTPTVTGIFTDTIKATNAGGTGIKVLTITINAPLPPAPVISSAATATGTISSVFTAYTIAASNSPTSYAATGLPAGLSIDVTTGIISGTPTVSGTFIDTIKAINSGGTGTKILTITINPAAPVISSAGTASGTVGVIFTGYTITASNNPTSYAAVNLPGGLTINTSTGVISGTPTIAGTFIDTIKATNITGTGTKVLTITINPASPVISSASTASGTVGVVFSAYTITASNTPTSFAAVNLPAGLSISTSTGIISGTPTITGIFIDTIKATNITGTGTKVLTITINPATPVISSVATASGTVGTIFTGYTIAASNNPTSYAVVNLPGGLLINTSTGVISGTPTVAGTFIDTIKATNITGTGAQVLTITINAAIPGTPIISSVATATGIIGSVFTPYSIVASNSPTSYAATGLPAGLSIDPSTGIISGTATVSGTFTDTLKATNAGGTGTKVLTITIYPLPPVISSPAIASGIVGTTFSYTIIASNSPTSYAVINLPAGLAINTSTGIISGTPTTQGTFVDTIKATNAGGTGTKVLTITINPAAPVISSAATASGIVGATFSYSIIASNSPTSYAAINLPAGLTINTSTGIISGTPTTQGTFIDTIKATNITGTGTKVLTITINPAAPVISSTITASGIVGTAFSYTIVASNSPTSYAAINLPAGLTINTSTGVISGTPTIQGTYIDTIKATNITGTGTKILTITINPAAPVISSAATANGIVGTAFSYTIVASNSPTSYAVTNLPAGLTINTSTGVISGTPATQGTFVDTIKATNAGGTGTKVLTITIDPAAPVISSAATVSGIVGTTFSYTIVASNSPASYTAVNLPAGLSINTTTGVISGTPTTHGVFIDTIKATNAGGTGTKVLTITIDPAAPVISSAATASGIVGTTFSYTIVASNSPVSYTAVNLPAGLSINTTSGIISGTPTTQGIFIDTIKATNAGGTGKKVLTITIVLSTPVISSASTASGTIGAAFTYTIAASNNPTSYAVVNLPAGLTINTTTGVISGTPTVTGTFIDTIKATNAGGTGTKILTITIYPNPPAISSASMLYGTVGVAFNDYSITATNSPTSYTLTENIPSGLSLSGSTISGTPTVQGVFVDTISAINAGGYDTKILIITIDLPLPEISSASTAIGTMGATFNYAVTASNQPTVYRSTILPAGLSMDPATGIITGMPTDPGTFIDTVSATNSGGTATKIISITIMPSGIVLMPNPVTQDHFTIVLPGWDGENATVEIINFLGAVMQTNNATVANEMIAVYIPNLISGNYVVVIQGKDKRVVKKFVVK